MTYNIAVTALIVGTIVSLITAILLFVSKENNDYELKKEHKDLFLLYSFHSIGFTLMRIFGFDINSAKNKDKVNKLLILCNNKVEAKSLYAHSVAAVFTNILIAIPLACFVAVLCNNSFYLVMLLALAGLLAYIPQSKLSSDSKEKRDEIMSELPSVIMKILLFTQVGLTPPAAWEKTARSSEGTLYSEMLHTIRSVQNENKPFSIAITEFSERCDMPEVRKFALIFSQGITQTAAEMIPQLTALNSESWENRMSRVKEKGTQASSKLLIPIFIMLAGAIVMIVVPMFANLGF